MAQKKIKGKIIRILDTTSLIINLGKEHGITYSSIFYVLGDSEPVIDPETNAELGSVKVAKIRVKASQVFDKFTIATTSWVNTVYKYELFADDQMEEIKIDEGELKVNPEDIQPWKAKSESPIKVGDEVEVTVSIPTPQPPKKGEETKSSKT